MPTAATFTLNNASAVAKTFTLLSPSAGYGGVAEWNLKEGTIQGVFPKVTTSARISGNQSRVMQGKLRVPSSYTDTVTGLTRVGSAAEFNFTSSIPDDFPEALKADYAAYAKNLVAQAIVNEQLKDGTPAT
jgi:hypothetical protein